MSTFINKLEGTLMGFCTNYMIPMWGSSQTTSPILSKLSWLQKRLGSLLEYITIEDSSDTPTPNVTGYLSILLDDETNDIVGMSFVSNTTCILKDLATFCNCIRFNIPYSVHYKKVYIKNERMRRDKLSIYSTYNIVTLDDNSRLSIFCNVRETCDDYDYKPMFWLDHKKPSKQETNIVYDCNGLNVNLLSSVLKR